jgi:hypothetical protein
MLALESKVENICSIVSNTCKGVDCRSQWPHGLRRRSAAARLLRLWVRIPLGSWISVCSECWVLSCRGICDEQITRPSESYRLWCVVECDLETSWTRRFWSSGGRWAKQKMGGGWLLMLCKYLFHAASAVADWHAITRLPPSIPPNSALFSFLMFIHNTSTHYRNVMYVLIFFNRFVCACIRFSFRSIYGLPCVKLKCVSVDTFRLHVLL